MKVLYETAATASGGGRSGRTRTADGELDFQLVVPKELGGTGGPGANPEKLFAAGYSACFLGALQFVASQQKIKLPAETTVSAKVGIGPRDDGTGFSLDVALEVSIPGVEQAVAEDLVARAHVVCPYSEATRGNLNVGLTVRAG